LDRFLIFRSCFGWDVEFFHLDVQQYTMNLGVFLGHILQKFGQVKKIERELSVTNSFLFLKIRQIFKKFFFWGNFYHISTPTYSVLGKSFTSLLRVFPLFTNLPKIFGMITNNIST
jgi:hypothetical protein